MKMYLSAFLPLLLLLAITGCSKEQFGSIPQSESNSVDGLQFHEQSSCSSYTLIKPKVDILYVVDNSASTVYLGASIKEAIKKTVDSISTQFDYRVIGIPLLAGQGNPNTNYQVLTNSTDLAGIPTGSRRINSSSEFDFFSTVASGAERGLERTYNFVNNNISGGLFRQQAHLITVLISNGRDSETEVQTNTNGETSSTSAYGTRIQTLKNLKTSLNLKQFRFFSVTAKTVGSGGSACSPSQSGWLTSFKSYVKASQDLYTESGATDSSNNDAYNLCPEASGLNDIYVGVNRSIQQLVIAHKYKYWPITFAESTTSTLDTNAIRVYKYSANSGAVEIPKNNGNTWDYYANPNYPSQPVNTRVFPLPAGEPVSGKHFIEFKSGNEIVYPDCVIVKSSSQVEYFQYFALVRRPLESTIVVRKNGVNVPKSTTDGWSFDDVAVTINIKANNANPPVMKTGYMIKFNGSANYYQSGDNIEVYYTSAGI